MSKINELYNSYHTDKNNIEFINFLKDPNNEKYINDEDNDHQTVLHNAAYDEEYQVVQMLLDRRADANKRDKFNRTPLSYCVDGVPDINIPILRLLITRGANINETDIRGFTSLHYAVLAGNLVKVKKLLSLGADINQMNNNLETPLRLALARDIPHKNEMLQLLFKQSVIIHQDFSGQVMPSGLTDGVIIIGSTLWSDSMRQARPIDRTVKGFEHAITNAQEFEIAAKAGTQFNFEAIIKATKGIKTPEMLGLRQIAESLLAAKSSQGTEIKKGVAQSLANLLSRAGHDDRVKLEEKIKAMPQDLQDLIDAELNAIALAKSGTKQK